MALKGDLKSLPFPSLLQLIEGERKSGRLVINYREYQRQVFFKDGSLVFFMSDDPKDFFGHFLIRHGKISEDVLRHALQVQAETKEKIGEILTRLAGIPEASVQDYLVEKMRDSVYQLFLLPEAEFVFHDDDLKESNFPSAFQVPLRNIIMEGVRRQDEFKRLRERFPNSYQTFLVDRSKVTAEVTKTQAIQKLLELLEKNLTIADLCLQFHAFEFTILSYLDPLLRKSVIAPGEIREPKEETALSTQSAKRKPTDVLYDMAKTAAESKNYKAAIEIYADILKLSPSEEDARGKMKAIQATWAEELSTTVLQKGKIFFMAKGASFDNVKLTPVDGFILSRINGQWTIGEIISVVPSPEHDVLFSLKKLIDLGLITDKG